MIDEQLTEGAIKYKMGKSYNECKTAKELNDYFREERNSRCGFHDAIWSQMGRITGSQLRLRTPENNTDTFVFAANKVKV